MIYDLKCLIVPQRRMMPEFFARQATKRGYLGERYPDRAAWEKRKAEFLQGLRACKGVLDQERTPLHAQVRGTIQEDGYRIEKIVFQSSPGVYVTGVLYLPEGESLFPVPAVLGVHGHTPRGKHDLRYQFLGIGFAKRGYGYFQLDAFGAGERLPLGGHDDGGVHLAITGASMGGVLAWDNMRALDYLCSRPEVDASRIGVTGASGGGNQSMYIAALDERITAASPTASVCTYPGLIYRGIGCPCEFLPNLLRYGDLPQVLALIAPRALLVNIGTEEETFPIWAAREAYDFVRHVYQLYGAEDRLTKFETIIPHGYYRELRESTHRFFDKWLRGIESPEPVSEPSTRPRYHESAYLDCFPDRKLPEDAKTIDQVRIDWAARIPPQQMPKDEDAWEAQADSMRAQLLKEILGDAPEIPDDPLTHTGTLDWQEAVVEKTYFHSEDDIIIPMYCLFHREAPEVAPGVIVLDHIPKDSRLGDGHINSLLDQGIHVFMPDLRGFGETRSDAVVPIREHVFPGNLDVDFRNSVMLGRPLLGLWVHDCRAIVEQLIRHPRVDEKAIGIYGQGTLGMVALLAGGVEARVSAVFARKILGSYRWPHRFRVGVAARESDPKPLFVAGILKCGDVPELAALMAGHEPLWFMAGRKLVLSDCVDGRFEAMGQEQADSCFAFTRQVFDLCGGEFRLAQSGYDDFEEAVAASCAELASST